MDQLRLLTLPYHLGHERVGMGNGPDRFVRAGVADRARDRGLRVEVEEVRRHDGPGHEVGAAFSVLRAHTARVGDALEQGAFPLTLGGNCATAIGITAALGGPDDVGVVWFDAHGDVNTPETTPSGFLDGMSLATLAGWCWSGLAASVPGFRPVPEAQLLHAAGRDFDPGEERLLERSDITVVRAGDMRTPGDLDGAFLPAIDRLAERAGRVHVHIDLDAIDTADGHANEFAVGGGPSLEALEAALRQIAARTRVVSADLTSYDPEADLSGDALGAGLRLLDPLLDAARG